MGSGTLIGKGARFLFEENKDRKRRESEAELRRAQLETQKLDQELKRSQLKHQKMVQAITTAKGDPYATVRAWSDHFPDDRAYQVGKYDPKTGETEINIGSYLKTPQGGWKRNEVTGERIFQPTKNPDGTAQTMHFANRDQFMLHNASMANPDIYTAYALQQAQQKNKIQSIEKQGEVQTASAMEVAKEKSALGVEAAKQTGKADLNRASAEEKRASASLKDRTDPNIRAGAGVKPKINFTGLSGKPVEVSKLRADQAQKDADKWSEQYGQPISAEQAYRISKIRSNERVKGKTMASVFDADMKSILNGTSTPEEIKTYYVNQLGLPEAFVDEAIAKVETTKDSGGFWAWLKSKF